MFYEGRATVDSLPLIAGRHKHRFDGAAHVDRTRTKGARVLMAFVCQHERETVVFKRFHFLLYYTS